MDSTVLTIDEVAPLLRVSSDTIYRLATREELGGRKIGHDWRIPRSAIEPYLRGVVPAGTSSTDVPAASATPPASGGPTRGRSP